MTGLSTSVTARTKDQVSGIRMVRSNFFKISLPGDGIRNKVLRKSCTGKMFNCQTIGFILVTYSGVVVARYKQRTPEQETRRKL